jgi:hypothetical protein
MKKKKLKKVKKPNYWMYATIILGIFLFIIIVNEQWNNDRIKGIEKIDIAGFNISKQDVCNFINVTGLNKPIRLCDIENNICKNIAFIKNPCEEK